MLHYRILILVQAIVFSCSLKSCESSICNIKQFLNNAYSSSGYSKYYIQILNEFIHYIIKTREYLSVSPKILKLKKYAEYLKNPGKFIIGTSVHYKQKIFLVEDYVPYLDLYYIVNEHANFWVNETEICNIQVEVDTV